ncbi:ABC-type bacteriocin/lantibiotic exporter with double-glycine peptidase domain [Clostridium sardiniense]|nr:ABC-type bacteriocin/lantibiotic exporter with double-glycine peptidase domain [Clostridium sardiniense]
MVTSALGIIQPAEKLGFSAKGVKANKSQDIFGEILLPAIFHVVIDKKFIYYVIIHNINEKEIIAEDKGKGIVKYKPSDFFAIWTVYF